MVIIVGNCRPVPLFGKIFPENDYITAENHTEINSADAVVIVDKTADVKITAALAIIVEGDDHFHDFQRGIQLITCGSGHKNTVSITSRTDDKIAVSLNRAIRSKNGIPVIDLHITVAFGTNISVVAESIRNKTAFAVKEAAGTDTAEVNVYIDNMNV